MKKFFEEFKEFINRGNVMDMVVFLMVKALNTASEKLAHKEDKPSEKPAKKMFFFVLLFFYSLFYPLLPCLPIR